MHQQRTAFGAAKWEPAVVKVAMWDNTLDG